MVLNLVVEVLETVVTVLKALDKTSMFAAELKSPVSELYIASVMKVTLEWLTVKKSRYLCCLLENKTIEAWIV